MNFNTLPEEQDNLELINRLQDFHRMTPEDRASLASIERRLAPLQLQERTPAEPEELSLPEPIFLEQPHPQKVWTRRLELFAAVLVVVLLIVASVSAFVFIQGKNRPATGGKTTHSTGTVQPTSTVQLSPIPGETRTLIGNSTQLHAPNFFMATAQVGWAQGQSGANDGSILRTTDGGKHWQSVTLPQELSGQQFEVYAFDANMAFVVPLAAQPGIPQSYLYRTLDGGATWQRGTLPAFPSDTGYNGGAVVLDWSFLDHQQGWMTVWKAACCGGDTRAVTLAQLGGETLYHTTDGGLTWLKVVSLSIKYQADYLTFINAQTGWLTTYVDDPAHPSLGDALSFPATLYITHDGGYTWQQQQPPASGPTASKSSYDLTFFSASKGYLLERVSTPNRPDQEFLYVTRDDGNSWQILGSSIPSPSYGLNIVNDSYVFDNTTLFTLRNGQWVAVSKPFPFTATTVEFFSSLTGFALANTGNVYQTDDGGQTWQEIGTLSAQ